MNQILHILTESLFAAIAAMGFAIISNPPKITLFMSGAIASLGYMARMILMELDIGIIAASFCASLLVSLCSIPCAKHWHIPAEIFAFPALLPMVPGMYAYKAILACLRFMETSSLLPSQQYLVEMCHNGMKAFLIICALVVGVMLPLFAARKTQRE